MDAVAFWSDLLRALNVKLTIGILVFDGITQLDATGPYEVLTRIPAATVLLIARTGRVVRAGGLRLVPDATLADCPQLDVLCVPGGRGIDELLLDDAVLAFVRRQARRARYVTSVCTGSLLLGAAGLLRGRRAACHWLSLPLLTAFGARASSRRVVTDGKFITAGGVTAGLDFGLRLAAVLAGRRCAEAIELALQYDPQPPFRTGTPRLAGPRTTAHVAARQSAFQARRAEIVAVAARRLRRSGRVLA